MQLHTSEQYRVHPKWGKEAARGRSFMLTACFSTCDTPANTLLHRDMTGTAIRRATEAEGRHSWGRTYLENAPTTGTEHWHTVVSYTGGDAKSSRSFNKKIQTQFKKLCPDLSPPGINSSVVTDLARALGYCGKHGFPGYEENNQDHMRQRGNDLLAGVDIPLLERPRVYETWNWGTPPATANGKRGNQGKRKDIDRCAELIRASDDPLAAVAAEMPAMLIKYPNGVKALATALQVVREDLPGPCGFYYYGPPGVGKTTLATADEDGRTGEHVYMQEATDKWFDGIRSHHTVIVLDDLDPETAKYWGNKLKRYADKFPCQCEIKGGKFQMQHTKFIVTSNYSLDQLYGHDLPLLRALKRRFTVTHIPFPLGTPAAEDAAAESDTTAPYTPDDPPPPVRTDDMDLDTLMDEARTEYQFDFREDIPQA